MKRIRCLILAVAALAVMPSLSAYAGGYYYQGGYRGGWGGYRGGWGYRGGVWVGPGIGAWGPGWGVWGPGWWGAPVAPYYAPPVVIEPQPQIFVEPQPQPQEQSYWYYCPDPQGYYPYVPKCPKGWLKVIPSPTPPQVGE